MSNKIGLKLWSINTDYYYEEAKRLYDLQVFDYIELYVVPDTLDSIQKWKKLNIPFTLHAPHFAHKVNLALENNFSYNYEIFQQVNEFAKELNSKYIIVHGGIEGNIRETAKQFSRISSEMPNKYLIENKPYFAPLGDNPKCRGFNFDEIKFVMNEADCGFCLDIGHSTCAANSLKISSYEYLEKFLSLNPSCCHISGNLIDSEIDSHMHISQGNYDYKKILDMIGNSVDISIETVKDSKFNLDDFVEDVKCIKMQ